MTGMLWVGTLAGLATILALCWLALDAIAYRSLRRAVARGDLSDETHDQVQRFRGNGFGQNPDIDYRYTKFRVPRGKAILLRGQVAPEAGYFSVIVYDTLMQSVLPELVRGPTLLNHEQLERSDDGHFTVVLAAEDPGRPNWLDTSATAEGIVFERHIGGAPEAPSTLEIVDLAELR